MAELFKTILNIVGLHLKNIHAEGQLAESATAEDFSVVQNDDGGPSGARSSTTAWTRSSQSATGC